MFPKLTIFDASFNTRDPARDLFGLQITSLTKFVTQMDTEPKMGTIREKISQNIHKDIIRCKEENKTLTRIYCAWIARVYTFNNMIEIPSWGYAEVIYHIEVILSLKHLLLHTWATSTSDKMRISFYFTDWSRSSQFICVELFRAIIEMKETTKLQIALNYFTIGNSVITNCATDAFCR